MKIIKLLTFVTVTLLAMSGTSNANIDLLPADDIVGISFWVISDLFYHREIIKSNQGII